MDRRWTFRRRVLPVLVALAWPVMSGCGDPTPVETPLPGVWAMGPSERIDLHAPPTQESRFYSPRDGVIHLRGAVNETVAFQLVLTASDSHLRGLDVAVEALTSDSASISPEAVRIFRQWPITVERYPNWYLRSVGPAARREIPDALVPVDAMRHGRPFSIRPDENLAFWIEIKIDPATAVGVYQGAVVVDAAGGGGIRTPITLEVQDLFLSPEDAVPILANVQLEPIIASHTQLDPENLRLALSDPDARSVLLETFQLLHDHGLHPFTSEVHPRFEQDIGGTLHLDWTDYDAFCGPLIDGRAYDDGRAAAAWPLPVDLKQPDPALYGGMATTVFAAILRDYTRAVVQHSDETRRIDKSFVYFDVPNQANPRAEDLANARRLATLTHLVDERLRFVARLVPQDMAPFGWFEHGHADLTSIVDVWATPARYQHGPTLSRLQTLGQWTWLVPDRPPFSGSIAIEAPPIHARSLPWQAFLQGHDAILLDRVTDWPTDVFDKPIRDRGQATGGWLVYPGTMFGLDGPVPSVRLKQLQQGLQDYARLRLLSENGRAKTAQLVAASLIKAAGTDAYGDNYQDGLFGRRIDEPDLWELAKSVVDDELQSALAVEPVSEASARARRRAWAALLAATRSLEAWPESARLRFDAKPERGVFVLDYEVGIRSELRTPVEGRLTFGPMPPGMVKRIDNVVAGPIPEMGQVRKRLVAEMPAPPLTDLEGHCSQEILFDAGASGNVKFTATTSVVHVPTAPLPITVDGRLDDWTPNVLNSVGDFRLITARGRDSERPRAQNQTIAYFTQAGGTLYIGLHAAAPGPEDTDGPPVMRNYVEYEDLMPLGEDLIEILIDPTNTGTQSDDLYHIVLKATGNPIFERGVRTTPPIGEVRPWPGLPPRCCVVSTAQGWSAEIAIPISVFGPEAAEQRVWGLNLARLSPVDGEYSDWARAPRYCYDPRTLGNLVWPDEPRALDALGSQR